MIAFDSKALNGLRGFASVHVLVFHVFLFSSPGFSTFGQVSLISSFGVQNIKDFIQQVQMPLFFLLSGFCLALAYGKKNYKKSTMCCGPCSTTTGCDCPQCSVSEETIFDSWGFYYARMVRILPVYYAIYLFALPLFPFGYGDQQIPKLMSFLGLEGVMWGSLSALYGVQMWIPILGFGPVGPSWTVSTLFFFYLVFPR